MPRFWSKPWIVKFNELAATVVLPEPAADTPLAVRDGSFAVCLVATGGPNGKEERTLQVSGGRVSMAAGCPGDAQVTVTMTFADALAMAMGTFSPAQAVTSGKVRVHGDLGVLAAGQAALNAVGPALAPLRADTTP
jgi:SCP-2 sterol transfer family